MHAYNVTDACCAHARVAPGLQPESEVTALLVAAEHGHEELVRQLVELRADVTRTSSSGNTALHFAARSHNTAILTLLHDAGANCAVVYAHAPSACCPGAGARAG